MEMGVWLVTAALMFTGLVGTVVPILPGPLLIFLAALVPWFSRADHGGLQWWSFLVLGAALAIGQAVEFLSGAAGSRWFGGSRWGSLGAVLGGIVGLFFLPFGLFLGPLAGAFLCEWLFAKKEMRAATSSGVGSVIGTLTGMVAKFVIAILMIIFLVLDFFWIGNG